MRGSQLLLTTIIVTVVGNVAAKPSSPIASEDAAWEFDDVVHAIRMRAGLPVGHGRNRVDVDLQVSRLPDNLDDPTMQAIHESLSQRVRNTWGGAIVGQIRLCGPDGFCRRIEEMIPMAQGAIAMAALSHRQHQAISPLVSFPGALSGKRIVLSPGHGYTWSNGSWGFQRGITCNLREDIHTNQTVIDALLPMLTRAGAMVISARERSYVTHEALLYPPSPVAGDWGQAQFGWQDPGWLCSASAFPCEAVWSLVPEVSGLFSLDVFFVPRAEGTQQAVYRVQHPGGVESLVLDQRRGASAVPSPSDGRWIPLGLFMLRAGDETTVSVLAEQDTLNADVVRFGGGMGSADFGGGPSGRPRWQESALAHLTALRSPAWIVGAGSNDVVARPLYALFQGADLFISIHTNAFDGTASGTSTYVWHHDFCPGCGLQPIPSELPPGTLSFASLLHGHVMNAVRASWDANWPDQDLQGCNFGELRPLAQAWSSDPTTVVPGALIEIAFHDNCKTDAIFLRERRFRREVARAILKAVIDFFRPPSDPVLYPPLPPRAVSAVVHGTEVHLSWLPQEDPLHPEASRPDHYLVYRSEDGEVFSTNSLSTTETAVDLSIEPCRPAFFKVTAANSAGESEDSIVVGARGAIEGGVHVLLVDGMDRWVQTVEDPNYGTSFVPIIVNGMFASADLSAKVVVDTVSDEAAGDSLDLAQYDAVLWFTGETSTRDKALTPQERDRLASYLDSGGRLLISGAELAWYLGVTSTDPADEAFLRTFLHTTYTKDNDDAGTNTVDSVIEGPLEGLPAHTFGTGQNHSYLVEYPDVLPPDAGATVAASYSDGHGPAILAYPADPETAPMRLLYAGYPIETIEDPEVLTGLLERALAFLVPSLGNATTLRCIQEPEPDESGSEEVHDRPDPGFIGPDEASLDPFSSFDPHCPDTACGCDTTSPPECPASGGHDEIPCRAIAEHACGPMDKPTYRSGGGCVPSRVSPGPPISVVLVLILFLAIRIEASRRNGRGFKATGASSLAVKGRDVASV